MWWVIGLVCSAAIGVAYLVICLGILSSLIADKQLRANRLGAATAAVFFVCAVHHGGLVVHMLLPYGHLETAHGLAMRASYDWEMATWDLVAAAVAVYYWTLRRSFPSFVRGAKLVEEVGRREHEAVQLNDAVLQGLVVAKLSLELDQRERAMAALDGSITAASSMISKLLGPQGPDDRQLLRAQPASFEQSR